MSKNFRMVDLRFWTDAAMHGHGFANKAFYNLLFTNELSGDNQLGIYEITIAALVYYSELEIDVVNDHLKYWEDNGKITYDRETKELCLHNFLKRNYQNSQSQLVSIMMAVNEVKNKQLIKKIDLNGISDKRLLKFFSGEPVQLTVGRNKKTLVYELNTKNYTVSANEPDKQGSIFKRVSDYDDEEKVVIGKSRTSKQA